MQKMSQISGAQFRANSFFRSTQLSLAMADAGLIPCGHLVREMANRAVLRHHHDNRNIRPSCVVAF